MAEVLGTETACFGEGLVLLTREVIFLEGFLFWALELVTRVPAALQ